ncbi:hypothetical protein [uncultured Metabacillus sp.]|uniref:hypothetical protein n=1 Tax=uncultured Metabacillus sp. TaxID=2860135 RepID=UPI002602A75F|nr:hypothetical protein [uncultured Metabacillus sp.]
MRIPIKGVKTFHNEESESVYFYNEEMLDNGILIEESTLLLHDSVETMITVYYINKVADIELDAASYIMYWGELLEPIQTYGIIKNIYELYNENSSKDFVEIMYNMSSQSTSSSMQSLEKNGREIFNHIKQNFEIVKSNI